MMMMSAFNIFFANPILDQQNGILVEETHKEASKKVILRRVIESVKLRSKTKSRLVCKGFTHEVLYLLH